MSTWWLCHDRDIMIILYNDHIELGGGIGLLPSATMSRASRNHRGRAGGTSKSKGVPTPQPVEEIERFTSKENKAWYESHKTNKILVEKRVHPKIERIYELRTAFNTMGWGPILSLEGEYFPTLVREFYANMVDKEVARLSEIKSFVKGRVITITHESLLDMLGIPVDGLSYNLHRGDKVISDARNRLNLS